MSVSSVIIDVLAVITSAGAQKLVDLKCFPTVMWAVQLLQ